MRRTLRFSQQMNFCILPYCQPDLGRTVTWYKGHKRKKNLHINRALLSASSPPIHLISHSSFYYHTMSDVFTSSSPENSAIPKLFNSDSPLSSPVSSLSATLERERTRNHRMPKPNYHQRLCQLFHALYLFLNTSSNDGRSFQSWRSFQKSSMQSRMASKRYRNGMTVPKTLTCILSAWVCIDFIALNYLLALDPSIKLEYFKQKWDKTHYNV
jgi:hypothetical protein